MGLSRQYVVKLDVDAIATAGYTQLSMGKGLDSDIMSRKVGLSAALVEITKPPSRSGSEWRLCGDQLRARPKNPGVFIPHTRFTTCWRVGDRPSRVVDVTVAALSR